MFRTWSLLRLFIGSSSIGIYSSLSLYRTFIPNSIQIHSLLATSCNSLLKSWIPSACVEICSAILSWNPQTQQSSWYSPQSVGRHSCSCLGGTNCCQFLSCISCTHRRTIAMLSICDHIVVSHLLINGVHIQCCSGGRTYTEPSHYPQEDPPS